MKNIRLYKPTLEELEFRRILLLDERTMSYNHNYGGTIDFSPDCFEPWYKRWLETEDNNHFYRYLYDEESDEFVGEVAWHKEDDRYLVDVIVMDKFRNQGVGKIGLNLLMSEAKKQGIEELWDTIAIDNPSISLFLKIGFKEEYRTEEYIAVRKVL